MRMFTASDDWNITDPTDRYIRILEEEPQNITENIDNTPYWAGYLDGLRRAVEIIKMERKNNF